MKTISCEPLPEDETEFFEQLLMYFPTFIEIKLIMKNCFKNAKSMQDLADALEVSLSRPFCPLDFFLRLSLFFYSNLIFHPLGIFLWLSSSLPIRSRWKGSVRSTKQGATVC